MSKITTHILDTAKGRPAEGVSVTLYRVRGPASAGETEIAGARTNKDGRIADWQVKVRDGGQGTEVDAGGKPMQTDTSRAVAAGADRTPDAPSSDTWP